jgi:hypothetical protein
MAREEATMRSLAVTLGMLAVLGSGARAVAASDLPLPLPGVTQMVVDPVSGNVLLADFYSATAPIAVVNPAGTSVTTIAGETGATALAIDGRTLYVDRCGANAVDVLDLDTLTQTDTFSVPGLTCASIAVAGGRLWFTEGANNGGYISLRLASVTLDVTHTVAVTSLGVQTLNLAAVPGHPDELLVGDPFGAGETDLLDASTDDPTVLSETLGSSVFSVAPDGSAVYMNSDDGFVTRPLSDLSTIAATFRAPLYGRLPPPAPSPDGAAVATVGQADSIFAFATATSKMTWGVARSGYAAAAIIAYSADSARVYEVFATGGTTSLRVVAPATAPAGSIALSENPVRAVPGRPVKLTGKVTLNDLQLSGLTVDLVRTGGAGGDVALGTMTLDPTGAFTFATSAPATLGVYRFRVDDPVLGHASVRFASVRAPPPVAVTTSAKSVKSGRSVTLSAHLGAWAVGRTVAFLGRPGVPSIGRPFAVIGHAVVRADGSASLKTPVGPSTAFIARFEGDDAFDQVSSPEADVVVRAVLRFAASGGYATQGGVHLYHFTTQCVDRRMGCPEFTGSRAPHFGGIKVVIQVRKGGKWRLWGASRLLPGGRFHLGLQYLTRSLVGLPARERFTVAHSPYNLAGASPWAYFEVTT